MLAAALCSSAAVRQTQAADREPLRHGLALRPERGTEGFLYLHHADSGKWVGQEIQLAVPAARPLPEPLAPPGRSAQMEVLLFGGLTIESAAVVGGVGNRQLQQLPSLGDWYWWWINKPIGDVELRRRQRLGVQIAWPSADAHDTTAQRLDPMEVFDLPEIDAQPLGVWTPWQRASAVVDGVDARFQVARGRFDAGRAEPPVLPFELRSRSALWDSPLRRQR